MNKTKQILSLYDGWRTTAEIAEIVGCNPGYVRVVARQRCGKGLSEIDIRYRKSPHGSRVMSDHAERSRPLRNAYIRAYRAEMAHTGDGKKARLAGRLAYRKTKTT